MKISSVVQDHLLPTGLISCHCWNIPKATFLLDPTLLCMYTSASLFIQEDCRIFWTLLTLILRSKWIRHLSVCLCDHVLVLLKACLPLLHPNANMICSSELPGLHCPFPQSSFENWTASSRAKVMEKRFQSNRPGRSWRDEMSNFQQLSNINNIIVELCWYFTPHGRLCIPVRPANPAVMFKAGLAQVYSLQFPASC